MASNLSLPEEDLSCPVCCDIYRDPVVLLCSHSFCKACLQEYWKRKREKLCPVCRRRSSTFEPPCNLVLKRLCEGFLEGKRQTTLAGNPDGFCSLHTEKLKLFCLIDQEPVCVVCHTSMRHKEHTFCPTEEAAQDHKVELQIQLKLLKEKRKVFDKVKLTLGQMAEHIKVQAKNTEKQIKEEFKQLRQFLQEEEDARIAALKEEGQRKSQKITRKIEGLSREISTLSDTIRVIKKELRAEDISFLQNYKATVERAQCTLPDPQLVSGALIDVAKHLGNLTFRVWEKMKERVKFSPVILDPNTADEILSLSGDLTSGRYTDSGLALPDNPERNTRYSTVLGSEGFCSGQHSWEVEVGDHPAWNIGVAKESIDRKGKSSALPQNGIWALVLKNGAYTDPVANLLNVKRSPQRIRVQLDYDRGVLSFYDPDYETNIYTHKDTFKEKVFPYFNIEKAGNAKHNNIKICQSDVSLSY